MVPIKGMYKYDLKQRSLYHKSLAFVKYRYIYALRQYEIINYAVKQMIDILQHLFMVWLIVIGLLKLVNHM